jgi:hydroxymethylbilane synthase
MLPIRGNVPTRLEKVASGESYDATILAAAGLGRLGYDLSGGSLLIHGVPLFLESLDWMLPAPGQGAVAVETRSGDRAVEYLRPLHDAVTARCVEAERLVLKHLGGGCHLALGALAIEEEGILSLKAVFVPEEGAAPRPGESRAFTPSVVARAVADQLLLS